MTRLFGLALLLATVLATAGCCIICPPRVPAPLPPVPAPRTPVAVANLIELKLSQYSPLADTNKTFVVRLAPTGPDGDWLDPDVNKLWQVLSQKLKDRLKHVTVTSMTTEPADFILTVKADRGNPSQPTVEFRLLRAADNQQAWTSGRESLILSETE